MKAVAVNNQIDKMLRVITDKISGFKIVTILIDDKNMRSFDVFSDGRVGYNAVHFAKFLNYLHAATTSKTGTIIVRQFTDRVAARLENGTEIPWKNIYGFRVIDKEWYSVPIEHLRNAYKDESDYLEFREIQVG